MLHNRPTDREFADRDILIELAADLASHATIVRQQPTLTPEQRDELAWLICLARKVHDGFSVTEVVA